MSLFSRSTIPVYIVRITAQTHNIMNKNMINHLLCVLLLFCSFNSIAEQSSSRWISEIAYIVDPGHQLTHSEALEQLNSTQKTLIDDGVFNLGQSNAYYWLKIDLFNPDNQTVELRLLTGAAYRALLMVSLIDENNSSLVLKEHFDTAFSQRNNDFRYLNSRPFELEAKQTASLLIQYHSIGSSYMPLSMETEQSFAKKRFDDSVDAAFFYSFSIAAIIVFLLISVAMMNKVSALYALLFFIGLLFLASMEGYAFKYLWPSFPHWNHLSPLVLQYLVSALGFYVAYHAAFASQKNIIIRKSMLIAGGICSGLALLSLVLPFVFMASIAAPFMALMFLAQGYAITTWASIKQRRNSVAIIAAILLAIFVCVLVLLSFDASLLPGYFYVYSTRIVYIVAVLATMTTVIAHVSGLRMDHEKTLENELVLMKREVETNKALYEAEQNYSRAQQLATLRQQQLATASHDMRQPLVSLRSTIDAIVHDESSSVKNQLHNAFDYLNNLCSQYLSETRPEPMTDELNEKYMDKKDKDEETIEPYSASLIIDTAARMFNHEAADKGLRFKSHTSSVMLNTQPLIVMRIVNNLISNAIKHTSEGTVLIGARRRKNFLSIQVIDTGAGMSEQQIQQLTQAYEKGPDSSGEGLGLAICKQLAEQHGMTFNIQSTPDKGTRCCIDIPRVN